MSANQAMGISNNNFKFPKKRSINDLNRAHSAVSLSGKKRKIPPTQKTYPPRNKVLKVDPLLAKVEE